MTISRTWWLQFCGYRGSQKIWDQASLPVKLAGLDLNQTKVTAASAYVGSCTLTKSLVAAILGVDADKFEPSGVPALLAAHEMVTGNVHTLAALCDEKSVQQKLSTERHTALFDALKACTMPHASDWLLAPRFPVLALACSRTSFVQR